MSLKLKNDGLVSGWGEAVHPWVRLATAIIGMVGILSLALSAFLIYFGKRDLQVNFENIFDWLGSALMAFYGMSIAVSSKAPGKPVGKKVEN
jgi:hypothetical protein